MKLYSALNSISWEQLFIKGMDNSIDCYKFDWLNRQIGTVSPSLPAICFSLNIWQSLCFSLSNLTGVEPNPKCFSFPIGSRWVEETQEYCISNISFLLLCGGLTNSLSLKIAQRIADSSLVIFWCGEDSLHRDKEVRPRSTDAFLPVPFQSTKNTKKENTSISALHIVIINSV